MKEINAEELKDNPFKMIGKDWMLITAEKDSRVNMMTASWGGTGILWGKNVVTVYIRRSRFTKTFVDETDHFSLCVLPESYRKILAYCGKISGRDEDKVTESGLTVEHSDKTPYFKESKIVFICRKLYAQEMNSDNFVDKTLIPQLYSDNDWHTIYVAEIEKVFIS